MTIAVYLLTTFLILIITGVSWHLALWLWTTIATIISLLKKYILQIPFLSRLKPDTQEIAFVLIRVLLIWVILAVVGNTNLLGTERIQNLNLWGYMFILWVATQYKSEDFYKSNFISKYFEKTKMFVQILFVIIFNAILSIILTKIA